MNWYHIALGSVAALGGYAALDYMCSQSIREHANSAIRDFIGYLPNPNTRRARGYLKNELAYLEQTPTLGLQ